MLEMDSKTLRVMLVVDNPEHRDEVARLWDIDRTPHYPGRTAVEMFDALESG